MLNRYQDRQTAAERLVKTQVEECKYLSIKNPESVKYRQRMMVVSLAIIASYDPYDEMVKAALIRAQQISYAAESLHKVAYSACTSLSRKGIQKIDPALLRKVNALLGCDFISKNGDRSTINLTKLVGYTRDQLISAFDGYITPVHCI